jgi:hypothetical protein
MVNLAWLQQGCSKKDGVLTFFGHIGLAEWSAEERDHSLLPIHAQCLHCLICWKNVVYCVRQDFHKGRCGYLREAPQ